MRLQQLMTLLTVAESGSVTRAAAQLNIAQSAVSRAVHELEKSVGAPVLERHPWGVEVTVAGQVLVARARAIRAEFTAAREEVASLARGPPVRVRMGAGPTAAAFTLPRALLRMQHDGVTFRVTVTEGPYSVLMPLLLDGEIEAVLGPLDSQLPAGVNCIPLYTDELVVVARAEHPLVNSATVSAEQLRDCAWMLPPHTSELWRDLVRALECWGVAAPDCVVESESVGLLRAMLQFSDMLTILPRDLVRLDCQHGVLAELRTAAGSWRRPMGMVHRTSSPIADRLQVLLRALHDDIVLSARK